MRHQNAWWVYNRSATRVSMKVFESRIVPWTKANNRKLLVLLAYPGVSVREICEGRSRDEVSCLDWHPREFRGTLDALGVEYIHTLPAHVEDFRQFRLTPQQYTDRYYIGHYNPAGNAFFARAIKDSVVDWLDTPPPAYQGGREQLIRFRGYLPE